MIQCDSISVPHTTSFTWRPSVKSSPKVPRFIIVSFQTNKRQNPSIFYHAGVKDIYAILNSTKYPAVDNNISFPRQQFSRAYGDAALFRSNFLTLMS